MSRGRYVVTAGPRKTDRGAGIVGPNYDADGYTYACDDTHRRTMTEPMTEARAHTEARRLIARGEPDVEVEVA